MSKIIKLYMRNQKGSSEYSASAEYCDGKIKVLKGSKINSKVANSKTFKLNAIAQSYRDNNEYTSKDFVVLKDIEFNSASTAAQYVGGYSLSGKLCWKDDHKNSLKDIIGGGKNE